MKGGGPQISNEGAIKKVEIHCSRSSLNKQFNNIIVDSIRGGEGSLVEKQLGEIYAQYSGMGNGKAILNRSIACCFVFVFYSLAGLKNTIL